MTKQQNGKMKEFRLAHEIFEAVFGIAIFGGIFCVLINILGAFTGGLVVDWYIMFIIGLFIGAIFGICYAFKLRKFAKKFGLRPDNEYSIDKVKDYFGTPSDIKTDRDCYYYTFEEDVLGMLSRTHIFTANKSGIVTKHELTTIGLKQKN